MNSKPNFLFIQADQFAANAASVYGNTFALTPNIAALANSGVVFDNAYSPFPLCAPSRFGMMSGRIPSRIGAYDNACEFPAQVPTFAHYLRRAGYKTILSGKIHFIGPDQLHGFEERLTSDIYPGDFTWTERIGEAEDKNKSTSRCVSEAGPCAGSVQLDYDNDVVARSTDRLATLSENSDHPFLMVVSMTHPHDPYYCLQEHWDRYDDIDIPMPMEWDRQPSEQDALGQYICRRHGFDGTFSPETIKRARRGYYGSVSYIDDQVGRLLGELDRLGLRENTVVVFTSDHGEMLGERGLWFKRHFYESSARVPLIISKPGNEAGSRRGQNVSLIDLMPTLFDLANDPAFQVVAPIEGRSLAGLLESADAEWDNVTYSETMSDGLVNPAFMVKRDDLKLIHGVDQGTQLYDLSVDPMETQNIIAEGEYADCAADMIRELERVWDADALQRDIAQTIQQRILIREAHAVGEIPDWDFEITGEEGDRWCRSGTDYSDWALNVRPAAE